VERPTPSLEHVQHFLSTLLGLLLSSPVAGRLLSDPTATTRVKVACAHTFLFLFLYFGRDFPWKLNSHV
jgi:hypothetical protein